MLLKTWTAEVRVFVFFITFIYASAANNKAGQANCKKGENEHID